MTKPLPESTLLPPTEEQRFILGLLHSTDANLMISSVAGSGKTTMLEMIQSTIGGPILCLAFNTRIAERMRKTFLSTTTVRTFNSLGHRIWAKTCSGSINLSPKKSQEILHDTIFSLPRNLQREANEEFWEIISAVSLAKALGYVPERYFPNAYHLCSRETLLLSCEASLSDLAISLLDEVLVSSIKSAYSGFIDFNDQIYMPALFGGTYPRFPLVLVDEAQDLSPVNHQMLSHLKKSRIIAVGDPNQSIYAFRGAVRAGMRELQSRFQMIEAPLSVSFRCPKKIVELAHWRAPQMKWAKDGGKVAKLRNPHAGTFTSGSAVICRNNAPLYSLAAKLLSNGRSVSVTGSDMGPRVRTLMKRLGNPEMEQPQVVEAIESWRQEKLAVESKTANDVADCMLVFAKQGETLGQSLAYAESLFEQKGTITLITGHKAKGLEWGTVFHLDPWLISGNEQDLNLLYVIQTRSLNEYYEIESREIRWT